MSRFRLICSFLENTVPHMIINHEYKFIFLKTRKTAGTSLEISLSTCSGDKDIVTSIVDSDETIRKEFGGVSAQNFNVPFKYYNNTDWLRLLFYVNKVNFGMNILSFVLKGILLINLLVDIIGVLKSLGQV
jgi:hypothetical protein